MVLDAQGNPIPPKPEAPKVANPEDKKPISFHGPLHMLGMFFGQCLATPNLIVGSFTLEIAEGKISVMDASPGGATNKRTQMAWYMKMKASVGAQNRKTGEMEAIPMLWTLTTTIPKPEHAGRIAAFPVQKMVQIMVSYLNLPAMEQPDFVKITFSMEKDDKGVDYGRIECSACNQNGGRIQLDKPKLKIVTNDGSDDGEPNVE